MSAVCYKYRYTVKPFLIVPIIGAMFADLINTGSSPSSLIFCKITMPRTLYQKKYVDRRCIALNGRRCEGQCLCRSLPQHPCHHPRHHPCGVRRPRTVDRLYPSCQCGSLRQSHGAGHLHIPHHPHRTGSALEGHRLRMCVSLRDGRLVIGHHFVAA